MNVEVNDEDFGKNSIETHNAFICTDDGIHLIGDFDLEYAVEALMNLIPRVYETLLKGNEEAFKVSQLDYSRFLVTVTGMALDTYTNDMQSDKGPSVFTSTIKDKSGKEYIVDNEAVNLNSLREILENWMDNDLKNNFKD